MVEKKKGGLHDDYAKVDELTEPVGTERKPEAEIVTDRAETKLSDLWTKEDYWAIWLGFLILAIGLLIFLPRPPEGMEEKIGKANATMEAEADRAPFRTVEWYQASDAKEKVKATDQPYAKSIGKFLETPSGWSSNPVQSLVLSEEEAAERSTRAAPKADTAKTTETEQLGQARTAQEAAAAANFEDPGLNDTARESILSWRAAYRKSASAKKSATVSPHNRIPYLIALGIILALFFAIGMWAMRGRAGDFLLAFPVVFLFAILAFIASNQASSKEYGIEFAAWAILFGLIISNTVGTPKWLMPAVQVEYYIKTGLVLLGAEILFAKILSIGIPGIFVAWVVTPIVLIVTFIFGQRVLKMPSPTLNMVISSDMSVCGVSAAIATAAACRAKKEELTLSIGLSLVFTAIMMIVMPAVIKATGMDHVLGGAWMGGTIDATGAVAAAGAFLSERALYTAATIKMIQNILIGAIAFAVAVYWCAKYECAPGQKVSPMEIWHRFPKFVLGFIAASIIFSALYANLGEAAGHTLISNGVIRGLSSPLRNWFFCLAFVSIGLATDFRELAHHFKGGKPLILYVCGQSFNLALTLLMAYIMFFKVFPEITAAI